MCLLWRSVRETTASGRLGETAVPQERLLLRSICVASIAVGVRLSGLVCSRGLLTMAVLISF